MRLFGFFALSLVLLFVAVGAQVVEDEEIMYNNNELFPRNSLYGKLQETLAAQEMAERQFTPINQNTGQGPFSLSPLVSFLNRLPLRRNPEFSGLINTYDSCKSPDGEMGLCMGAAMCTVKGGKASGTCNLASVCCVSSVAKCSGTVTLNNTYWQSPAQEVNPQSTCALTVRLDQNLPEQKRQPVCQLRVDFVSFTIAQPSDTTSVCATDTFQVSSATAASPIICGDNKGQHMYVDVDSSAKKVTDIQLTFLFGAGDIPRSWGLKIAMIPCGATYAAPPDCLQYFTGNAGTVKSFNWIDTATTATRQLANQNYAICFRNELLNDQRTNGICFQACTTTSGGQPFKLTLANAGATSRVTDNCKDDFLMIVGGTDAGGVAADRYCGARLNPTTNSGSSVQVCTKANGFRLHYRTDDNETGEGNNVGFCLNYMQRVQ